MRMISTREARDFAESVVNEDTLHSVIQWIARNQDPEDVFSEGELADYATNWANDNKWIDPRNAHPHWDNMTDEQKDEAIKKAY